MKKSNEIYFRPAAMNMVEEDGKIWMALANCNGICEVNKATRKARICKVFEGESLTEQLLYCHVVKVENNLVFSPGMADKIAIYDLKQDSITYLPLRPLKQHYKMSRQEIKFWNIFHYQSDVYLIGFSYPAIIKLDMISMQTEYITDWVEVIEENVKEEDVCGYFSDGHVLSGDTVLLPISNMKAVLELDLKSSRTRLRKLNVSMKGIGGLSSIDGENIWLIGKEDRTNVVCYWNRKKGSIKEFSIEGVDGSIYDPFYAPICIDSKVYLMPLAATNIYEIDINTGKVKKCKALENLISGYRNSFWMGWKVMMIGKQGKTLTFLSGNDLCWHEFNIMTNEVQNYFIHWEDGKEAVRQYFNDIYQELKKKNTVLLEMNTSLMDFANIEWNANSEYKRSGIGKKVYDRLCGK